MTTTEILLWDVLPYVAITTFVVGTIWRYRYDKFGWTTRSSQLYERKLIRIASPLFHLGILAVVGGPRRRPADPRVLDRGGRALGVRCTTPWPSVSGCSPGPRR